MWSGALPASFLLLFIFLLLDQLNSCPVEMTTKGIPNRFDSDVLSPKTRNLRFYMCFSRNTSIGTATSKYSSKPPDCRRPKNQRCSILPSFTSNIETCGKIVSQETATAFRVVPWSCPLTLRVACLLICISFLPWDSLDFNFKSDSFHQIYFSDTSLPFGGIQKTSRLFRFATPPFATSWLLLNESRVCSKSHSRK